MNLQVIVDGQPRDIFSDMVNAAYAFHNASPTNNSKLGLDNFTGNKCNNPFAGELANRLATMVQGIPSIDGRTYGAVVNMLGELAICFSATKMQDSSHWLAGAYTVMVDRSKQIGMDLEAVFNGLRSQYQQPPQQATYGNPYQQPQAQPAPVQAPRQMASPHDNPYANRAAPMQQAYPSTQSGMNPQFQQSHAPRQNAYDMVNSAVTSHVDDEIPMPGDFSGSLSTMRDTTPDVDLLGGFDDAGFTPEPVATTGDDFDTFDSFTDTFDDVPVTKVDVLNHSPEAIHETIVIEAEDEPDHEFIEDISDLELFTLDRNWIESDESRVEPDGTILGAVIVKGKLHLPPTKEEFKHFSYQNHVEFRVARSAGDRTVSEPVYFEAKDIPMDYERLSPNPIIIHEKGVAPKTPRMVKNEETRSIDYHLLTLPDTTDNRPHPTLLATSLIGCMSKIEDPKDRPKKLKTGVFIGHTVDTLRVVAAASPEEAIGEVPEKIGSSLELLLSYIDPMLQAPFISYIDDLIHEMLVERMLFDGAKIKDVVKNWEQIFVVASSTDYTIEEVTIEMQRIAEAAFFGTEYTTEVLDEEVPKPDENTHGIYELATMTDNDLKYYAVNVRRAYAVIGTWLTSDEMGLTEDGRLSVATHADIYRPVVDTFEAYPHINKIRIFDVNGQESTVYRGIGRRRAIVSCK